MTRAAQLVLISTALAASGCGSDDDCRAACQKMMGCEPDRIVLEECLNECLADRGNQSIATCVLGITGCLPDSPDAQRCFLADTDCVLATKKINACMEAIGSTMPPARFTGWCNDRARLATLAGMKTVAFRSWSVTYLACTIDPKTCRCPGQPWYTEL